MKPSPSNESLRRSTSQPILRTYGKGPKTKHQGKRRAVSCYFDAVFEGN